MLISRQQYEHAGCPGWKLMTFVCHGLSQTRHYYYTDSWQDLEERLNSSTDPEQQNTWGIRYIDDLVLRDRTTEELLDERLYACQDANWNVTAIVDTDGEIQERYEYDPYGNVTFLSDNFTVRSTSEFDWTTLFTGRDLNLTSQLWQFRNRNYASLLGQFLVRDFWGYIDGMNLYSAFFAPNNTDPMGTMECNINIYIGHNYNVSDMIGKDFPPADPNMDPPMPSIPPGNYVIGVGCGSGEDVVGDEGLDSIQDFLNQKFPCNSVECKPLQSLDDPIAGLTPDKACEKSRSAVGCSTRAVINLCKDKKLNSTECDPPQCETIKVTIQCDGDAKNLFEKGLWKGNVLPKKYWKNCIDICGKSKTFTCKK